MPGELDDVVGAEIISSAFTNDVKNRTLMRYSNAAARDASIPAPIEGNFAYLQDIDQATLYANGVWETVLLVSDLPPPVAQLQAGLGDAQTDTSVQIWSFEIFQSPVASVTINRPAGWSTFNVVSVATVQYANLITGDVQLQGSLNVDGNGGPTGISPVFNIGDNPIFVATHAAAVSGASFVVSLDLRDDAGNAGTATGRYCPGLRRRPSASTRCPGRRQLYRTRHRCGFCVCGSASVQQ